MISFSCKCGKKFKVDDKYAGKKAKCPTCSNLITIPNVDDYKIKSKEIEKDFKSSEPARRCESCGKTVVGQNVENCDYCHNPVTIIVEGKRLSEILQLYTEAEQFQEVQRISDEILSKYPNNAVAWASKGLASIYLNGLSGGAVKCLINSKKFAFDQGVISKLYNQAIDISLKIVNNLANMTITELENLANSGFTEFKKLRTVPYSVYTIMRDAVYCTKELDDVLWHKAEKILEHVDDVWENLSNPKTNIPETDTPAKSKIAFPIILATLIIITIFSYGFWQFFNSGKIPDFRWLWEIAGTIGLFIGTYLFIAIIFGIPVSERMRKVWIIIAIISILIIIFS